MTAPAAPPAPTTRRTVPALLASSLVGRLPQAMSAIALVRIALDTGGGYAFAGALAATYVVASTAGTPVLSRLVDRTGRPRLVLLAAALTASVALVAVAVGVRTEPVALVAAAIAGAAFPPLEPVLRSLWPRIAASPTSLSRLFAIDAAAQEVLFILGPLLAVAAVSVLGSAAAVLTMAVGGLVGTGLFCGHRLLRRATVDAAAGRHPSALRTPAVRALVVAQVAAGLPIGVLTITAARYAGVAGAPALSGWGLAANAVGALLGALLIARFPLRAAPARALRVVLAALALLYLPTAALALPPAVWLAGALLAGLCLPPLLTQVFAVTAAAAPASALTEANGWAISAFSIGIAAGTALAGLVADAAGTAGAVVAVLGASAAALLGAASATPRRLGEA